MEKEMPLPEYYDLVRTFAMIGAVMGLLAGVATILFGLPALEYGFLAGVGAIFSGALIIIGSLAGLGVTYCFLAIVKAQIDTRNAIVRFTSAGDEQST